MDSKRKNTLQLIAVYTVPYLLLALPIAFKKGAISFFMPLMLMAIGHIGSFALLAFRANPMYSTSTKIYLLAAALLCLLFFFVGLKYREYLWGKCLSSLGFYMWPIVGFIAMWPTA